MAAVAFTPSAQEKQMREGLASAIESIVPKIEDLVQSEKLGREMNFEELRPTFQKTILLFKSLSMASLDFASEIKLRNLTTQATKINNEFNSIKAFAANIFQQRQNRIDSMKQRYDEAYTEIAPVIGVSQQSMLDERQTLIATAMEQLEQDRGRFEIFKAGSEKEIAEILEKAKSAAGKVGISEHAAHFSNESNEHRRASWIWLGITTLLAIGTGLLAWQNYGRTFSLLEGTDGKALPTGAFIHLAIAKIIIFSILFSAVLWAGRIYRAHRHNYVVNKHRQNALSTFETFASAAGDAETKNAVLLQATQCIFSPQSTGYLGSEKETDGQSPILEIIRSVPTGK